MRRSLVSLVALALAGCSDEPDGPFDFERVDSGRDVDVEDPLGDADEDGLCNGTETDRGLDPTKIDTDDDGFPDAIELLLGYEADRPASPERSQLLSLEERAGAMASTVVVVDVEAGGEDFDGAFDALPPIESTPTAADFFDQARAIAARPITNAAVVEAENERFRGVVGDTQLQFELSFRFDGTPRRCAAIYPFRYIVKRSDGVIVGAPRYALYVSPDGDEPTEATWCPAVTVGCF